MIVKKNMFAIFMLLTLFVAALGMAAAKGSTTFTLGRPLLMAGKEMQTGEYEISWEPGSQEVTVLFLQKGKEVAKVQGKILEQAKKYNYTAIEVGNDSSGRDILKALQIGGKKFKIVFD